MEIEYLNEQTWVGSIGHTLVLLGFVGAALSAFSYFMATLKKDDIISAFRKKLGRLAFFIHSVSILIVIGLVFYMLSAHLFEYHYAWKYSSMDMEMKYIFSCFWGGQQGSFLLWSFWQLVIGNILIFTARKWESPVMTYFSIIQIFLMTMLLGVYVPYGEEFIHIGLSPFTLIRELPEYVGLPWTLMPDYLEKIPEFQDGEGLNPLLQNYWMTIHPPILFLGFALTSVPFCFAMAGLWLNKLKDWVKPALPWTYAGIMILGGGILMGGAWAYEALSFGGFWAWDPVENASLVPWLVLVGAGHVMLITKNREGAIYTSVILALSAFILVIYSTFLTRSGVLGDSSVHSFTGEGMLGQLLLYLQLFIVLPVFSLLRDKKLKWLYAILFVIIKVIDFATGYEYLSFTFSALVLVTLFSLIYGYSKHFPKQEKEEALWSREFWMFVGSILLTVSAILISIFTTQPVWNLIFETDAASKIEIDERIDFYNQFTIPFAIGIALIMGFSQFLKYKDTNFKSFIKDLNIYIVVSAILAILFIVLLSYNIGEVGYIILLFACLFCIIGNWGYINKGLKGRFKNSGSPIAHIGFGLLLLGALISTSKSVEISENQNDWDLTALHEDFDNNENIQLLKRDTVIMGDYFVSYTQKFHSGNNKLMYQVEYFDKVPQNYKAGDQVKVDTRLFEAKVAHMASENFEQDIEKWKDISNPGNDNYFAVSKWNSHKPGKKKFNLYPFVQLNKKFGNVPEPGTKHFLTKDIFTHVKWAELKVTPGVNSVDDDHYSSVAVGKINGDTIRYSSYLIKIDSVGLIKDSIEKIHHNLLQDDQAFAFYLSIIDKGDPRRKVHPAKPLYIIREGAIVPDQVEIKELNTGLMIQGLDMKTNEIKLVVVEPEFIVLEAIVFPFINILWIGCIVMCIGTLMAIIQRVKKNKIPKP